MLKTEDEKNRNGAKYAKEKIKYSFHKYVTSSELIL